MAAGDSGCSHAVPPARIRLGDSKVFVDKSLCHEHCKHKKLRRWKSLVTYFAFRSYPGKGEPN